MARWIVAPARGSLKLTYHNMISGEVFTCGDVDRNTPHHEIVSWVINCGEPNPGDVIRFEDHTTFFIHPEGARA